MARGANLYPPGVSFADAMAFFLWCFVGFALLRFSSLCFRCSRGPSFNRPSICRRSDSHTCFFLLFCSPFFVYLEMSLFPSIFCIISAFSLYGEYVVRSFRPDGVFSTL